MESVLIAYGWSRKKPATDLPDDILDLCPRDLSSTLMPRATGFIHTKRVPEECLSDPPSDLATAVTFFRITATVEQTRQLRGYAEWPTLPTRDCDGNVDTGFVEGDIVMRLAMKTKYCSARVAIVALLATAA